MSADLTCKRCNGTRVYGHGKCWSCHGEGRRRPELHEWDALEAEWMNAEADAQVWRDEAVRYRDALEEIRQSYGPTCVAHHIARAALDFDPERSTPLMVSKHPRDHHRDTALVYDDECDFDLAERCTCTEPPDLPYDEGCPKHG